MIFRWSGSYWQLLLRICCCILLLPCTLSAQTAFHLSTNNGLSSKLLTIITKDHHNNMWFGSYNGLYKHEGARIKWYNQVGNDSLSLSSGELHALFEDKEGDMWVGTTGGLDRMNKKSGLIRHYELITADNKSSSLGYIYTIFEDKENYLWLSTDAGLYKMNKATGAYRIIPVTKNSNGVPASMAAYHCMTDSDSGFWLSTAKGVVYYEYSSGKFYHHFHNPQKDPVFDLSSRGKFITSDLCKDALQNIWFIADGHLLAKYNLSTHRLDTFRFTAPKDAWPYCYSLAADFKGNIWVGFRHGGLMIFNTRNSTFTPVRKEDNNKILHSNYIYSLCQDYQHNMWVTTDEGIDIIDYYNHGVQEYDLSSEPDFTSLKYVSGMMSYDPWRKRVYIPFSQKKILFWFDESTKQIQSEKQQDATLYVWPVEKDILLKGRNRSFNEAGKPTYFPEELAATPYEIIWAASVKGVSYFKKQNGVLYRYADKKLAVISSIQFMKQACISADSRFLYFIDTTENLARQDIITGKFEHFDLHGPSKKIHFSFSYPRDIIDDGKGNIWITSQNGLMKYTPGNKELEVFTTMQGLSHSFTFALLIDNEQRLWVCSLGGIDWYNSGQHTFHNAVSNFNSTYMDAYGSSIMGENGSLYFQTGNKLYHVNPKEYFQYHKPSPLLQLNEVLVNEKKVGWDSSFHLSPLHHEDNRLMIKFSLLNFELPQKVRYFYRMDGIDKDWIDNGNNAEVLYNNLHPGNYIFRVSARNADGQVTSNDLILYIRIKPAFWQTNLFRIAILLLVALFIFLLFRRRVRTIKKKAHITQQLSELEARAIRAQMHPHFIFNSLNAIQELIVSEDTDSAYQYLSKFSKLLRMVLHHSTHNLISLEDEIAMNHLYLELESLRFNKSFHYTIEVADEIDEQTTVVPSLLLQPFIENAIWHGLIPKQGDKELTIRFMEVEGALVCEITDNGIGRKAAGVIKDQKIGSHNLGSKGMLLIKQRIDLMNATHGWKSAMDIIDLTDENGTATGTTIRITLEQTGLDK